MVLYLIRNLQTGREYVGTTVRTARLRWSDHLSACFGPKRVTSPLYSEMREFGREAFEFIELEQVEDYETLMARERAVILERRTLYPHGYNVVKGGRGNYGWVPSPDVRARMSDGQRGRKLSDEHKAKLSAAFKGRPCPANRVKRGWTWNKGVAATPEHRAKLSAAHKGQPWSAKRHAANALINLRHSAETRKLIADKKAAWWASLSVDAKAAHILKMKQGQKDN